jgi:hypothetical protein
MPSFSLENILFKYVNHMKLMDFVHPSLVKNAMMILAEYIS